MKNKLEKARSWKKFVDKNKIFALFILFVAFVFLINPAIYTKSALNAISVWAISVLPVLLPFFVFTRIIIELIPPKKSVLDKPFKTLYNTPDGSFLVFFLSVLSGYPMGAKLIAKLHDNKYIDKTDALSMLSFCSISGPMFMVGTVGASIFLSYKAGLIILISNILACLLNGLIYRKKAVKKSKENVNFVVNKKQTDFSHILTESVSDSLNSILLVGVYIVLSFLLIDLFNNLNILTNLSCAICYVFHLENLNAVKSVLAGLIEITRGSIDLSTTSLTIQTKTILASGLIGFGGLSVMCQSLAFIKKLDLKFKIVFFQKLTQGILATLISIPIVLCFFV